MKTNNTRGYVLLNALGLAFSVIPPAASVLLYFPIWVSKGGEYLLSGIAVLLLLVAFLPLFKLVRQLFKSPSGYSVWLAIFLIFLLASRIATEMLTISFIGFVGNVIGAVLFRLARRYGRNEE